jgi:hypothetical protein
MAAKKKKLKVASKPAKTPKPKAKTAKAPKPKPKGTWGGKRAGAGRKPGPDPRPEPHRVRPPHEGTFPLHATMKADIRGLARPQLAAQIAACVGRSSGDPFRIAYYAVDDDRVHLIVEADDEVALTRGMRGFAVRAARAVNGEVKRTGRLWSERYASRPLTDTAAVRKALASMASLKSSTRPPAGAQAHVVATPKTRVLRAAWRAEGLDAEPVRSAESGPGSSGKSRSSEKSRQSRPR